MEKQGDEIHQLADVLDSLDFEGDQHARGRVLLAVAAYPGVDDGLPAGERASSRDGPATRFCEAMLDWRLHREPLAKVRRQVGFKVQRRKYQFWRGIFEQGRAQLRAAEAAYWARAVESMSNVPLSKVIDNLHEGLSENFSIYSKQRTSENIDSEHLAKRIRGYDRVIHLVHSLRELAIERLRGRRIGNFGNIADAIPSLLSDYEGWPSDVVTRAESFRTTQIEYYRIAKDKLLPLTKRAPQTP